MNDEHQRVLKTFSFGVLSFFSNFIGKYFIFPLIIFYWGNDIFNEWILITNITLHFLIFDFGTKIYLGNKLAKKNDKIEYYYKYVALINLISMICTTICLLLILIIFERSDKIQALSNFEFNFVMILSSLLIIFNIIIGNLGEAALKPLGLYYKYQKIDFYFNLLTNFILILSLFLNTKIVIFIALNLILVLFRYIYLKKYINKFISVNDLILNFNFFNIKKFKIIVFNSVFFYLSNLINLIQSSTLIVVGSIGMGINQIGIFIVHKTLSSISNQISNILAFSFTYEYTKSYLQKNDERLVNYNLKISNYATITLNILLYFFAELIFNLWLQNKIQFNKDLFHILLIYTTVRSYGSTIANFLLSKNKHIKYNSLILFVSIIFIPITYFLTNKFGLTGLALIYLFYEVLCLIIGLNQVYLNYKKVHNYQNIAIETFKIFIFVSFLRFDNYLILMLILLLAIYDLKKLSNEY